MPDCAHCTCPRLDALEERLGRVLAALAAYERIEQEQLAVARKHLASNGGETCTRRDLMRATGCNRVTVEGWTNDPTFPPRVNVPQGRTPGRYSKQAAMEWIEEHWKKPKVAARLRDREGAG